ncbi:hypothetical protein M3Y97_00275800 [Aphelenchoides bicaudatus]|nr:hypothetical protein M3Y97_00275800 [Aphelenchoides bicaudatus]
MLADLFSFREIFALGLGFVGLSIAVLVQCSGGDRTPAKKAKSGQKPSPSSNVISSSNSTDLKCTPKKDNVDGKRPKNSLPSQKKSHSRRFSSSGKRSRFLKSTDKKTLGSTIMKVRTGEMRISEEEPHRSDDDT